MRRSPRFLALLFLVSAHAAFAQGINLRWTECVADGGTRTMAFACNTNAGTRAYVASFVLPAAVTGAGAFSGVIDIIAADVTLPEWWNFRFCRSGSVDVNILAAGPVLCPNPLGFCLVDGDFTGILPGVPAANGLRLQFVRTNCAGPAGHDLAAGVEYLGPVVSMNFNRTVGSPSCGGCATPVCLILTQLQVSANSGTVLLTQPAIPPDGNVITWQGAGLSGGVCQAATPTRRAVWGEIKALYR